MRRSIETTALALVLLSLAPAITASAQFTYRPPGELVSGSGRGRVDDRVYAPGIRFPIRDAPAYLNSQVWGVGGSAGPGGSQCDARNYSYPWRDNYCESRSWDMPLCPSGTGHQGQDMRGPSCRSEVNPVVAVTDGTITNVGSYSVYLTAPDGTRYDFLHMRPVTVRVGQAVRRGDIVGYVANEFGGTATTIHLHFNIRQNVSGIGNVYVPTYMSLVRAYETLVGPTTPRFRAEWVMQTFPLASRPFELAPGAEQSGTIEMRNTGTETWRPGTTFLGTTEPRDRASPIAGSEWINDHRAAAVDRDVPPGSTGRFTFSVRGPATPGDYPQYFNLVQEGVAWFSDGGGPTDAQLQVRVTVVPPVAPTDGDGDGTAVDRDCDDADATVHPGATEACGDGIDQDCDGADLGCPTLDGGAPMPEPDAATPIARDGGMSIASDAGTTTPSTRDEALSGGCACRVGVAREPGALSLLALAALALVIRRRQLQRRG